MFYTFEMSNLLPNWLLWNYEISDEKTGTSRVPVQKGRVWPIVSHIITQKWWILPKLLSELT